jgi:hypothetical protein
VSARLRCAQVNILTGLWRTLLDHDPALTADANAADTAGAAEAADASAPAKDEQPAGDSADVRRSQERPRAAGGEL